MKFILKVIFSITIYIMLWFLQCSLLLSIAYGLGMWSPSLVGGVPGIIGLITLYTSYVTTKEIHKISIIKNFFSKN